MNRTNLKQRLSHIKDKAEKLKSFVPAVALCLRDVDTPVTAKILAGLTVGYALSPVDLIPDFIPVLGYLDDLLLLPLLVSAFLHLIPKNIWNRNLKKAEGMWQDGKPKRWYCALPVLLLWGVVLLIIILHLIK